VCSWPENAGVLSFRCMRNASSNTQVHPEQSASIIISRKFRIKTQIIETAKSGFETIGSRFHQTVRQSWHRLRISLASDREMVGMEMNPIIFSGIRGRIILDCEVRSIQGTKSAHSHRRRV
jgi:hypothetical protein